MQLYIYYILLQASLRGPQGWELLMRLLLMKVKTTKKKKNISIDIEEGREIHVGKSNSMPMVLLHKHAPEEENHLSRHLSV